MKRVLLALTVLLMIPGMLLADASLGVYFGSGQLFIKEGEVPAYPVWFKGYLYIYAPHKVRSFQYQLVMDPCNEYPEDCEPELMSIEYPWNFALELGNPLTGHAVTYNPQLPCNDNGFDLALTFNFRMPDGCTCADIPNFEMCIAGAPESFAIPHPTLGGLYGIYDTPEEDDIAFDIDGLTSTICISETDTNEESWGAVKSMYR